MELLEENIEVKLHDLGLAIDALLCDQKQGNKQKKSLKNS